MFDVLISLLLIFICAILPFRIAFFPTETLLWKTIYNCADAMFLVDLVCNFFTTIYDEKRFEEVIDRKKIAKTYLSSWFLIDFFSIVPFEMVIPLFISTGSGSEVCFNTMVRK